jgi:hypothetical protein
VKLERLPTLIRTDVKRSWDPWTGVLLIACMFMVAVEKLRFCKQNPGDHWSPRCFWVSFPLAGLFIAAALMLVRRRGAKTLPTLLLLVLIGLVRDQVELAVAWFFLGLMWLIYILLGLYARILGR